MKLLTQEEAEQYQEAGSRCAIRLKNGREIEGYILECHPNHLMFGHGGPLAPEEDESIAYQDMDLSELYYYCDKQGAYLKWEPSAPSTK